MPNSEKTLKALRFGEFTVDRRHGVVKKRGVEVHLRPLVTRFLLELLERPDQLVTREHLRDKIWGSRVVEWEMGLHRLSEGPPRGFGRGCEKPAIPLYGS